MLPRNLDLPKMITTWATQLDPLISSPIAVPVILKDISLTTGANVVNHKLGRKLQGWIMTRVRASATFYDTQDTNQTPQLTLNLVSSAPAVVDILVF